jgi:hypothetical protein
VSGAISRNYNKNLIQKEMIRVSKLDKIFEDYNKSQDEYEILSKDSNFLRIRGKFAVLSYDIKMETIKLINEYDFIFNHEWGWAKSKWGKKPVCPYKLESCTGNSCGIDLEVNCEGPIAEYEYHLREMVKYTNPWDYLKKEK